MQFDVVIIGAGPSGLFSAFQAGMLGMKSAIIDSLEAVGGQCSALYPEKPIYDIPGYPSVLAGELIDKLMEQIAPFNPGFTLGERAESLEKGLDGHFLLTTNKGTRIKAPAIAIAGGLGCFEPRKPPLENLELYEDNGVEYIIKDPEFYKSI